MVEPLGLYIHYPWCVKKCPYCDFNSHPLKSDVDQQAYRYALETDWASQSRSEDQFSSVFFGGGTPSLFPPQHVAQLLDVLPVRTEAEITLEVNPGTQEHMSFHDYFAAGVNRLSIGAQSFNNHQLGRLGRIHQSREITNAFSNARAAGFTNINLDLMWGLPDQSLTAAMDDLEKAIELGPEHISWYQLTIEPKTEFAKRTPILPIEQTIYDTEQAGHARLAQAGFERYEISAFAKENQRCQHNLNYWQFGDYVGVGAGAHGKRTTLQSNALSLTRSKKASQPRLYLHKPEATERYEVATEDITLEFMMNALRLVDGVDWKVFQQRTGLPRASIQVIWDRLVAQDLLQEWRCAPTAKGIRYLDSVLQHFM